MNFKEAYRAANDEIHGDKSILAGINDKPKKIIYFKPALGMVAAAAVCAVTLFVYPYINQFSGNEKSPAKNDEVFLTSDQSEGLQVPLTEPSQPEPVMRKAAPRATAEPDSEPDYNTKEKKDISAQPDQKQAVAGNGVQNEAQSYSDLQEEEDIAAAYSETESSVYSERAASNFDEVKDDTAKPSTGAVDSVGGGGGGSSAKPVEYECVAVSGDQITIYTPQKGEIVLKTTDKTVIVNSSGEPVQSITSGARLVVVFGENIGETPSAVKIIVWEE